ncbi:MAG: DUF4276 family protein [Nitrospirota bacterium]
MTLYGIIVEGNYDKAAFKEIIKKCILSDIKIISRPCGGKDHLMKSFPGHLKSFCYEKQGSHIDKALVIRDADNRDPAELHKKMESKITNRTYPFEVKFIIIIQELETWFLADEEAISRVTQARSGKPVARVNENLESIRQPKEKLQEILSKAGIYYTPEVAKEIARELDLSKIEYHCPRFREFRQAVIDC